MEEQKHLPSKRSKNEITKISMQTFGMGKSLMDPFGDQTFMTSESHNIGNGTHTSEMFKK